MSYFNKDLIWYYVFAIWSESAALRLAATPRGGECGFERSGAVGSSVRACVAGEGARGGAGSAANKTPTNAERPQRSKLPIALTLRLRSSPNENKMLFGASAL